MNTIRASVAALVIGVTLGCEDVPLLPKWDADWYVPLPADAIHLNTRFPAIPIPPGTSATVADTSSQTLDESIGQLLDQDIQSASLIVTLRKSASLSFSASDTVNVASSVPGLSNAASGRLQVTLAFTASDTAVTDTVLMGPTSLTMLRQAATTGSTLYIEVRGRLTYNGTGNYTVQPSDSIGVRLAILARIPVSR